MIHLRPSVSRQVRLFFAALLTLGLFGGLFAPAQQARAFSVNPNVVISQVYGGGGNAGATLRNDFIELFNRGTTSVSLTGWSVQYTSSVPGANTTWQVTALSGSLAPGQYYLVQEAQGAGGTTNLPIPDAIGTIPMSATAGQVALLNSTTQLPSGASCPSGNASIIDFVGYGPNTSCSETSPTSPNLSNTTAALRAGNGCTDTNNNSANFSNGAPAPRNSATALAPCGGPEVVTVSIQASDASAAEAGPDTGSFTISRTGSTASSLTVAYTLGGSAASGDYSPALSGSATIANGQSATVITITPVDDAAVEGDETLTLSLSDGDNYDLGNPASASVTIADNDSDVNVCTQPFTPIYAIQGSGANAAITGNVTTQGVVVGDYDGPSPNLGGFYIQDPLGDGDPATSDGIFVFYNTGNIVSAGQLVRVTGFARERFNETALNGSNTNNAPVTAANIVDCGAGPSITPTAVDLPSSASMLERYEGMLVTFPEVLTVSGNFTLARFGELVLSAEGRNIQPTNFVDPTDDPAAEVENDENNVAAVTAAQDENLARRILLDDARSDQNPPVIPYIDANNTRRLGDTISGLSGVLGFGFSAFRVQPVAAYPVVFANTNPRPLTPPAVGGSLRVASFNVLNYFNTLDQAGSGCFPNNTRDDCRGADSPTEFQRQRAKIFAALRGLDADIVGLIEIENDGDSSDAAVADLVAGLNASLPPGALPYDYIRDPIGIGPLDKPGDTIYPGGDDAIKVAFIYRPDRVTPFGSALASADAAFSNARAPIAQTFEIAATGARFTPVINHFKSKNCGTPAPPAGDPNADLGDGQSCFNADRAEQAQALLNFINTEVIPTAGDPDVLVLGDLNGYTQEDPIDVLRASGLTNLVDADDAYSYQFQNQSGSLDHAMANSSLLGQVSGAAKWHINADEPIYLDYNLEFKTPNVNTPDYYQPDPFASSDHDPVLVGLNLISTVGQIKITKVVNLDGLTPTDPEFTICITGPSYPTGDCKQVSSSTGGDLFWNYLAPGSYSLQEQYAGDEWSVSYSTQQLTVTAGQQASATVTNKLCCLYATDIQLATQRNQVVGTVIVTYSDGYRPSNVEVTVEWTTPKGVETQTVRTGEGGVATFGVQRRAGTFTLRVVNISDAPNGETAFCPERGVSEASLTLPLN